MELANRSHFISIEVKDNHPGLPPERYVITYNCRSIARVNSASQPEYSSHHQVFMELDLTFPTSGPKMRMLTPIWHPNILHSPPHTVCMDPAYWAPGRTLDSVVRMVGGMIQYKIYHAEDTPPWPIDKEVARWVRWAEQHGILSKSKPVDVRELLLPEITAKRRQETSVTSRRKSKINLKVLD